MEIQPSALNYLLFDRSRTLITMLTTATAMLLLLKLRLPLLHEIRPVFTDRLGVEDAGWKSWEDPNDYTQRLPKNSFQKFSSPLDDKSAIDEALDSPHV
jgi:hypothetical protein